jgi:hypothetical protein
MRPFSWKCYFTAWIFGWVVAIYLPSALLALTGLSPLAAGRSFTSATFEIADEVAPAAKIGFAVGLGLLLLAVRRVKLARPAAVAADMLLAGLAMSLALALLPADWSRGFGIGMTGSRFAPGATAIYLLGAVFAGLVLSLAESRCLAHRKPAAPRAT